MFFHKHFWTEIDRFYIEPYTGSITIRNEYAMPSERELRTAMGDFTTILFICACGEFHRETIRGKSNKGEQK